MCEILLIKGNTFKKHFSKLALTGARTSNSDGAGYVIFNQTKKKEFEIEDFKIYPELENRWYNPYYDPLKEYREEEEEDECVNEIYQKQKDLRLHQLMITHFRIATSGASEFNVQPILAGSYLVIHNGIFQYKKLKKEYSDTRQFASNLQNRAKKVSKKATLNPEKEMKLIQKELEKAGGYYSIFIYSFITNKLYYYKNSQANFSYTPDRILGATNSLRFPINNVIAPEKEVLG